MRGVGAVLAGWPLRRRLVGLLLVLVAAALVLAGAAAVAALRGYLIGEVDRSITGLAQGMASGDAGGRVPDGRPVPDRPGPVGPTSMYVQVADATGSVVTAPWSSAQVEDPPVVPALDVAQAAARHGQAYTVSSQSGDLSWRVVTWPLADASGSVSVAQDISGIEATVTRLRVIELGIGIGVLLVLGVAGSVLVRRSLRPLDGVEHAAATIAAGDLSHRAPTSDPRTEVGSLALSFNTMVDTLEGAFAAQRASEAEARRSADLARASEARMRQFVADASHELRTPLTSVRGFAELYRIGAVAQGPALDDAMARIEAEASRMGLLVDDLLLLARMDQQRPFQRADVDIVDLAADAAAAARAAAPEREILVDVADDAVGLTVPGDPARLRQVVDNLLSNALRYSSPEQPVLVRVGRVAATAHEPGWGVVEVVDRGPGMTPEVAERVFERFYRADPARSREAGGSGLGLAIVAAIVAAHGGRVDVATDVGRGSAFRVRLPLGPASRSSRGDAASGAVSGAGPSHGAAGPPRSVVSAAEPLPGAGPGGAQ